MTSNEEISESTVFDIAISFAGEDRELTEELATSLVAKHVRVFYDGFYKSELWGKDLYEHIEDIYKNKSRFCAMLVSANYKIKKWTTHERKSAQARAFVQGTEYILPVKLDDTELPGLPETIGYIDYRDLTFNEFVDLILEKLGRENETELKRRRKALWDRKGYTSRHYCSRCGTQYSLENTYFCVECESAFCYQCVHDLGKVNIEKTAFPYRCTCGGRVSI